MLMTVATSVIARVNVIGGWEQEIRRIEGRYTYKTQVKRRYTQRKKRMQECFEILELNILLSI